MSYSNSENEFIDILKYMKKDVKAQIDLIRENAKKLKKEKKDIEDYGKYNILDSYNQTQYYNNISILGGRGSGKTSFLLDLRSDLIKHSRENSDIVFDIITPDIRDKEDILGWIISLLIKIAKKIKEDKDKNDNIRCNICKEQTKLDKCIYELKQAYFFRKNIHENIIANDYSSRIDYLNENEEKLNADVDLKGKFKNLVDEIIVLLSDNNEFTPLLIFMFDDVDIHANKINEVLSVIMMYLSHPNIISLIAGDYESAEENITLSMLEEDNILKAQLTKQKINKYDLLTIRKNRSRDFLKKILPPVYRHYINGLDNETKYNIVKKYLVDKIKHDDCCREILKKIEGYIKLNLKELGYENEINKDIILYDYMAFLDKNIRGTINVIDFIKIKVLDPDFKNLKKEERFRFLKDLLTVIILSNQEFILNEKLINNVINLSQYNKELEYNSIEGLNFNGYINYYAIIREIKNKEKELLSEYRFNIYYDIFMLANLFEILIIALNLRIDKDDNTNINLDRLHGLNEYIKIVNTIRSQEKIKVLPMIREESDNLNYIKEYIWIKQNIFKSLRYSEIQQLFREKDSGYLESIYIDSFNHKGCVATYIVEAFNEDREWSKSIIDWIFDNGPSKDIIEKKIIKNLEKDYKLNIGNYNLTPISLQNTNFDLIYEMTDDIGQSIFEYIKWIEKRREGDKSEKVIKDKLLEKEKIINEIEKDLFSISNKYQFESRENTTLEYNKISKIIKENQEFLNDEINKEIWSRFEKNLIIKGINENEIDSPVELIDDIIVIDIKSELIKLGIDINSIKKSKEYIIIKNNNFIDSKKINFIKGYYIKEKIINILTNEHPLIKLYNLKEHLDIVQSEYDYIDNEIKRIEADIKVLDSHIIKNFIYKYIEKKSVNQQHTISNKKLKFYIQECIELFIQKYQREENKKYRFESLLEYFYKNIKEVKSLDINIAELLSPLSLNMSEEIIVDYKERLKNIRDDISIMDIDVMISNLKNNNMLRVNAINLQEMNDRQKIKKISMLEEKLKSKRKELENDISKLKKDVFQYAFYKTLNIYLNYKVDYENEQMNKKVRTEYLRKKRSNIKAICTNNGNKYMSLKSYLKSKYNLK